MELREHFWTEFLYLYVKPDSIYSETQCKIVFSTGADKRDQRVSDFNLIAPLESLFYLKFE